MLSLACSGWLSVLVYRLMFDSIVLRKSAHNSAPTHQLIPTSDNNVYIEWKWTKDRALILHHQSLVPSLIIIKNRTTPSAIINRDLIQLEQKHQTLFSTAFYLVVMHTIEGRMRRCKKTSFDNTNCTENSHPTSLFETAKPNLFVRYKLGNYSARNHTHDPFSLCRNLLQSTLHLISIF